MRGDKIGSRHTITVEENAQRAGAGANAAVADLAAAKAAVFVANMLERHGQAWLPTLDQASGVRTRTVVSNDDFEVLIRLGAERTYDRVLRVLAVIRGDDNRNEGGAAHDPTLAGSGATVRIRLVLDGLFHRPRALDDRRGRVTGHQIHQHHVAPGLFHHFATHHLLARVISALDEHSRAHAFDQFEWRVLVENHDKIDRLQCREHFRATLSRIDWPASTFEPGRRTIAVETDHQPIAGGARFRQ